MNTLVIRLTTVVCVIGCQAVSSTQSHKARGSDNQSIQSGDLGKATLSASSTDGPLPLAISFWGQACVSIETFWGLTILVDPYPTNNRLGYPQLELTADLVLITHEHSDHTGIESINGKPVVLRGLTPNGDWAKVKHVLDRPPNQPDPIVIPQSDAKRLSPHAVHVRGIPTFHDDQSGARRGKNVMFLIEVSGLRILHCGDLGHTLTDKDIDAIGPIDLLMIPTGGTYTIDAARALRVSQQLKPHRWIWPIHYNTGVSTVPLETINAFLSLTRQAGMAARQVKGNTVALTRSSSEARLKTGTPRIIVSDWKPVRPGPDVAKTLAAMRTDRRAFSETLGKVTRMQLNHKPSDGTHTIRWNFEHTTGRELGFFSQVYHTLDADIPVINWNPAQMPPAFRPRHPEWDTAEMLRHVQRVGAFTERFSYLLSEVPADMKIEGMRFSVRSLSDLMVGHYRNHTAKAIRKFTLPDWPKR